MRPLKRLSFIAIFAFLSAPALADSDNEISDEVIDTAHELASEKPFESDYFFAPLINVSPTFGTALGGTGMYFFKFDENDKVSPPSIIQPVVMYSNTKSHFAGLVAQTYFAEDQHRVTAFFGDMGINNEFDNIGPESIDFKTEGRVFYGRYLYRTKGNLYAGLDYLNGVIDYNAKNQAGSDYLALVGADKTRTAGLGPVLSYDTRDDKLAASEGLLAEAKWLHLSDTFGSDDNFDVVEGYVNHYQKMRESDILASRFYSRFALNDAPYSGLSTVGKQADLRGYKSGENVAENLIAAQSEYRYQLAERWQAVGFGGLALLYDSKFESDNLYPSAGVGMRYAIMPEKNVNFRVDYAVGKNGNDGWYISVREAF